MKYCKECSTNKPLTEFGKNRATADGLAFYCKGCHAARVRKWKKNNWEKTREAIYTYRTKKKSCQTHP